MTETAVLLIDMQAWFWKRCDPFERDGALSRQVALIRHCKEAKLPLVVVECDHEHAGKLLTPIADEIEGTGAFRYRKTAPSALAPPRGDALDAWLRARDVGRLLLAGIYADYCVLDTARDASRLDYRLAFDRTLYSSCSDDWRDTAFPEYERLGETGLFENLL